MRVSIGSIEAFADIWPDKPQALKPLEEAAEVFGAWQRWDAPEGDDALVEVLLDEVADVIQACANLAAAYDVDDLTPYMERCRERNERRGRL